MKLLISTLFAIILSCSAANAQRYDRNRQYYSDNELNTEPPAYALNEMSITIGPYFIIANTDLSVKLQYTARVADHVQIAPMLTYINDEEAILGPGLNINFPFGAGKSYFYPGAELSYFLGEGMSYGAHIGYTGSVSKGISLNIEPGLTFIRNDAFGNNALFSILGGIRINL